MADSILVVDPVAAHRIVTRAKLSGAYYDVRLARNGAEMMAEFHQTTPDLVLLRNTGTGPDGANWVRDLRAHPKGAELAVLASCSSSDTEARLAFLAAGADDVVETSLSDGALLARIRSLLQDQKAARALPLGHVPEAPPHIRTPRIALILADRAQAVRHRSELVAQGFHAIDILDPDTALRNSWHPDRPPYDLFVLSDTGTSGPRDPGLMSELRGRIGGQRAALLLLAGSEPSSQVVPVLEMGLSMVGRDGLSSAELGARVTALLRRKAAADATRAAITAGLEQAVTDPLTRLRNRRYALARLPRLRDQAEGGLAVMMLDIDRFKSVNDRFGHAAGDAALVAVAEALTQALDVPGGKDALLARMGGEEFLVALPVPHAHAAFDWGERLRRAVRQRPVAIAGLNRPLALTISIGVSLASSAGELADAAIARADAALYRAKRRGRDRVVIDASPATDVPAKAIGVG